jgi:hypothetical protein
MEDGVQDILKRLLQKKGVRGVIILTKGDLFFFIAV